MRDSRSDKPSWLRLDNGLIAVGVLMLATFLAIKGWSHGQSLSGIEAFEAARTAVQSETLLSDSAGIVVYADGASPYHAQEPDYTLWSEKRIQDYQDAVAQTRDAPAAVLRIENLELRVPVYNGADEFNLNRGVARIKGTARVGEAGNLGIAGHRDGFFRPLKDIRLGDRLHLETWQGTALYRVSSITIVDPSELGVLSPTDNSVITLVTCYPFYYVGHAPQRFIVRAEAVDDGKNS